MANESYLSTEEIYKAITCALNISAPYKDETFTQDIYFKGKGNYLTIIYCDGTLIVRHEIPIDNGIRKGFEGIAQKEQFLGAFSSQLEYASVHYQKSILSNKDDKSFKIGNLNTILLHKCTKLVDFYNQVDKLHSVNKRTTTCKNGYTWSPEMLQKISTIANITGESLVWYFNKSSNESPCMVESESGSIRAYIMPMAESKEIEVEEFDDI